MLKENEGKFLKADLNFSLEEIWQHQNRLGYLSEEAKLELKAFGYQKNYVFSSYLYPEGERLHNTGHLAVVECDSRVQTVINQRRSEERPLAPEEIKEFVVDYLYLGGISHIRMYGAGVASLIKTRLGEIKSRKVQE